jgi:hypothetical protein
MYEIETIDISENTEIEESTFVSPINERRLKKEKKEKVEKTDKNKQSFSVPVTNNTFSTCRHHNENVTSNNINLYKKYNKAPTTTTNKKTKKNKKHMFKHNSKPIMIYKEPAQKKLSCSNSSAKLQSKHIYFNSGYKEHAKKRKYKLKKN